MTDDINHPSHYTAGTIECIDAIEAALTPEEYRGYLKGNILKYTWRERQKEGDKAMGKARWYIDRMLRGTTAPIANFCGRCGQRNVPNLIHTCASTDWSAA